MMTTNCVMKLFLTINLIFIIKCVDKKKFKTCDEQDFCKDLMALSENQNRYQFLVGSDVCNNGLVEAIYINTDDMDNEKSKIKVQISAVTTGEIVRVKITEVDPTFHRLEVFRDLWQGVQSEPINNITMKTLSNKNECTLMLENNLKLNFQYQPLLIQITDNELTYVSLNEDGLLQLESHKDEHGKRILPPITCNSSDTCDKVPKGRRAVSLDVNFKNFMQLYGLPEHTDSFAMDPNNHQLYRLYNLDVFEYEINERMALYGSVPFVQAHGVVKSMGIFWNNVAETWVDLKSVTKNKYMIFKKDTGERRLHFVSESGIIDLFIMTGPTPQTVSSQFASIVGFQQLPPLASLGFHQCRWNYMTQDETVEIVKKFDRLYIPLDYVWLDIEHTDRKKYFTWDPINFKNPEKMVESITALGRRLVTIVDPHVATFSDHIVYNDAIQNDSKLLVMKSNGDKFDGWCWPGNSVYPDFINPHVREWFSNYFNFSFYKGSSIDVHTWVDMNEPSVFSGPEVTLPKDTIHYGNWEHRDVHNIYGFFYHETAYQGLLKRTNGKYRPFVLSRSFYAGSQKYGSIWTGDNFSKWNHLRASIPMLLSLSISGIHFVGADVGGFFGHPSEQLYIRWIQASSMTPFMRSHAHLDSPKREPWEFSSQCLDITRNAIARRYTYLPYLYTLFYESHKYGKPIMKPLWFNFPHDTKTFALEASYMIGDALLAIPVLDEDVTSVIAYFPRDNNQTLWYDTETYISYYGGDSYHVDAPISKFPLFQKHGTIVSRWMRKRRSASRMIYDPLTLVVILDFKNYAYGSLYLDDGDTTDHETFQEYLLVNFVFCNNTLKSTILHNTKSLSINNTIERIIVIAHSLDKPVSLYKYKISQDVHINNTIPYTLPDGTTIKNGFIVRNPNFPINKEFTISFL